VYGFKILQVTALCIALYCIFVQRLSRKEKNALAYSNKCLVEQEMFHTHSGTKIALYSNLF